MATAKKTQQPVATTIAKTGKPSAKTAPAKEPKAAKPKEAPLPKSLAGCADEAYTVRAQRYALQKQVDALKARESRLVEELIAKLPKSQATGIAGKVCRAKVESRTVYQAEDWDKINEYIAKNAKKNPGVFALYQKRLSDTTIKEMEEAGVHVPGVTSIDVPTVSLTKV